VADQVEAVADALATSLFHASPQGSRFFCLVCSKFFVREKLRACSAAADKEAWSHRLANANDRGPESAGSRRICETAKLFVLQSKTSTAHRSALPLRHCSPRDRPVSVCVKPERRRVHDHRIRLIYHRVDRWRCPEHRGCPPDGLASQRHPRRAMTLPCWPAPAQHSDRRGPYSSSSGIPAAIPPCGHPVGESSHGSWRPYGVRSRNG
jgi:hypothetical protein